MNLPNNFRFVVNDDADMGFEYYAERQDDKYTIYWEEDGVTDFTDYDVEHVEDNILKKVWSVLEEVI